MALARQDFTIDQGSSFILQFDLFDDNGTALKTVKEVAGSIGTFELGSFSFSMEARKTKYRGVTAALGLSGSPTLISLNDSIDKGNTVDGFYVFANRPGRVKMVLTPQTTAAIKHGKYFYDVEVIETITGGTEVTKALLGRMSVEAETTN